MANVNLNINIPIQKVTLEEIIQFLKVEFPEYRFEIYLPIKIICYTPQGKFSIIVYQNRINVEPFFFKNILMEIIFGLFLGFTLIGYFLYLLPKRNSQVAFSLANSVLNYLENKYKGGLKVTVPTNCPSCKGPISTNSTLCEWCGSQIV
jgi:hypothetical protein